MIIRNSEIKFPEITKITDNMSQLVVNSDTKGKKYDQGKLRYDLIPFDALQEVVKVLTIGAVKYNEAFDEENWRKVDHLDRRYFAALMRHALAPRLGEEYDSESNVHHYAHAITNLLFLLQTALEKEGDKNAK